MGAGERVIVILPGLGCPLPSVEFAPLMRELAKKYTVCIIEYFGYGHSDSTDAPRTNANYVEEIREALGAARLKPPYVLMPYSISGVYSEYYAAKYPTEIAGLILLDTTPTVEALAKMWSSDEGETEEFEPAMEHEPSEEISEKEINELTAEYIRHGYTLEELEEFEQVLNNEEMLAAQDLALAGNIFEVLAMPIPKEIPILAFCSDFAELDGNERGEHEKYLGDHMARLGKHAKLVIIEGSNHMDIAYHCDYRKIISEETDAFLGAISKSTA
jgi:pimeloyl-ACP methyl ester carboxylesterase